MTKWGTIVILAITGIYEFIDSVVAITILRMCSIDFRHLIFEIKKECTLEPRYVGIREIGTKGIKK